MQLHNAQTDNLMDGGIIKKFGFWLGNKKYHRDVVEAEIRDALIIYIDFLKAARHKNNLSSNLLEMGNGDHVPGTMKTQQQ